MIAQKKYLNLIALLVAFIAGVMFLPGLTHAAVSSDIETADFGEVVLGESSTVDITFTNSGFDYIILYFDFMEGDCGFSVDPERITVLLNQPGTITITFTPSDPVVCNSVLYVYTHDRVGKTKLGEVKLTGKGIDDITVGDILDFFDQCDLLGNLEGYVPDKSAKKGNGSDKLADNRLNALRNMIKAAGNLIDSGKIDEACGQLKAAYKKMDRLNTPGSSKYFVTGVAGLALSDMDQELMDGLGCK